MEGAPEGQLKTALSKIFSSLGYELNLEILSLKRIQQEIKIGRIEGTISPVADFLPSSTYHSKNPIGVVSLHCFYKTKERTVSIFLHMKNKTIGLMKGLSYLGEKERLKKQFPKLKIVEARSRIQLLKLLQSGRIDVILDYKKPLDEALKNVRFDELYSEEIATAPVYFHISRKFKQAPLVMKQFNHAFFKNLSQEN